MLIAGGSRYIVIDANIGSGYIVEVEGAELYDPVSETWSTTSNLMSVHSNHTATLLSNGKVLIAGGQNNGDTAELYDSTSGTWILTGRLTSARYGHTATLLPNGKVLLTGSGGTDVTSVDLSTPLMPSNIFTGTLILPAGWMNSRIGNVGFAATTSTAGLDGASLSNDGVNWSNWITATSDLTETVNWDFGSDGADKPIMLRLRDVNGQIAIVVTGVINLDTGPMPAGRVLINGGSFSTTTPNIILDLTITSGIGSVTEMSFSNNEINWSDWQPYTASANWTLVGDDDGEKTVYARFRNAVGTMSLIVSDSVHLDTTVATEYGLSINNGALFTNQLTSTLILNAGFGTAKMQISNDGGFVGAIWEPYVTHRSWQITQYGSYVLPRVVYVRYKDTSDKIFGPYQDDIILDITAPTGSVNISPRISTILQIKKITVLGRKIAENQSNNYRADNSYSYIVYLPLILANVSCPTADPINSTLHLNAQDDVSGVADMIISNTINFNCAEWEPYTQTKTWHVSTTEFTTVYVRFRDNAGNVSQIYKTTHTP